MHNLFLLPIYFSKLVKVDHRLLKWKKLIRGRDLIRVPGKRSKDSLMSGLMKHEEVILIRIIKAALSLFIKDT
jgi:hypothetical protein